MENRRIAALDLETRGLIEKGKSPDIICASVVSDEFAWCEEWDEHHRQEIISLVNDGYTFVFHNANFDRAVLRSANVQIPRYHDTMIMSYVWQPSNEHSLKAWGEKLKHSKLPKPWAGHYPEEFTEEVRVYCLNDSQLTLKLYDHLRQKLAEDPEAMSLYEDIELPYSVIIQEMERTGLYLDIQKALELGDRLRAKSEQLLSRLQYKFYSIPIGTKKYKKLEPHNSKPHLKFVKKDGDEYIFEEYGVYNPKSGLQTAYVLQQEGWKPTKMTARNAVKTDEDTLEEIMEEPARTIATDIIEYRKLEKLTNSFVMPLTKEHLSDDGFVRGTFNQCVTLTGRLSCSNPNLQNIPKRTELGKEMRAIFTAPKGWKIFDGDLSNIEARVFAYYLWLIRGDDSMAKIFIAREDFHTANSNEWSVDRNAAKTGFFAKLYGSGIGKFARALKLDYVEAKKIMSTIDRKCPSLNSLIADVVATARAQEGVLHTLLGRRLVYPNLFSDDGELRSEAERQVFNALIQGSSADVLKYLSVDSMPIVRKYHAVTAAAVHDEYIGYVPECFATDLVQSMTYRWSNSSILTIPGKGYIPVVAEFQAADSWIEAH